MNDTYSLSVYNAPAPGVAPDTTPELIRAELIRFVEWCEAHPQFPVRGKKLDGMLDVLGALDDVLAGFMRDTTSTGYTVEQFLAEKRGL